MLKVAVLAPHYSEYSVRLAMALQESGLASVLLLGRNESFGRELTRDLAMEAASKLNIKTFPSESRTKDIYMSAAYIVSLVALRPDVILAPELGHWNYTPLLRLARRIAPIGLIVHDPDPHSGDDSTHGARVAPRIHEERDLASFFIVHGHYCERRLKAVYNVGARQVVNIFHGPIIMDGGPKPVPPGEPNFLLFGRMQAYKGLEVFLRALDILHARKQYPDVTIAGRGPEVSRLYDRLQAKNIHLIDEFIKPEAAVTLFQRSSCLVAPYLDATQSGVIAAALANGRPVIASDVGALGEVVKSHMNGLLVAPGDPHELAAAIYTVLSDNTVFRSLVSGSRSYADQMTWSRVAGDLLVNIMTLFPR